MNPLEALNKAVRICDGKDNLCQRTGINIRTLNSMLQYGKVSPKMALIIMQETGIHVSYLCPEYYPKCLFDSRSSCE